MKKNYKKPEISEVFMEDIAAQVTSIKSNTGLVIGGGGTVPARAKGQDLSVVEDEEDTMTEEETVDVNKWIDLNSSCKNNN